MHQKIIGRATEIRELQRIYDSKKAEFVAVYGRRRVGKTYLIHNFVQAQDCTYLHCVGLQKGTMHKQLQNFTNAFAEAFYAGEQISPSRNWLDAFERLTKAIKNITQTNERKIVLFFDEMPWMATPKSGFLEALDYHWNRSWSHITNLKLIICGSSASWIIRKIIYNKGGLHNRVTKQIQVNHFTLPEVQKYLKNIGCKYNMEQTVELYMAIGGIPFYLDGIKKELSAMQNIDDLYFSKNGLLFDEFKKLFLSLFKDAEAYMEIVKIIAQTRYGIARPELEKKCKHTKKGGALSSKLQALEDAGFILSFLPYQHDRRGLFYKVIDEFSLFYLQWVAPERATILQTENNIEFWQSKYKTPVWYTWSGYAFEAVCYKHLPAIRKALQIPLGSKATNWKYVVQGPDEAGAEIDLLFDRVDKAFTICEIKYTIEPFIITKEYAKILQNKEQAFLRATKTTHQIFLAMISACGIKKNMYSEDLITGIVTLEDLFYSG